VSIVSARPQTGRTHQIRVHFANGGHPLLGDGLYGGPRKLTIADGRVVLFGRALLHAHALDLPHPRSGRRQRFDAAPPADFRATAAALGHAHIFDAPTPLW
jgi:23S rRNA pseudouridine1911/1915/1917 synthase